MNPDSTRKAIRRSILKQEGKTRAEVWLTEPEAEALGRLTEAHGSQAAALRYAIVTAQALAEGSYFD